LVAVRADVCLFVLLLEVSVCMCLCVFFLRASLNARVTKCPQNVDVNWCRFCGCAFPSHMNSTIPTDSHEIYQDKCPLCCEKNLAQPCFACRSNSTHFCKLHSNGNPKKVLLAVCVCARERVYFSNIYTCVIVCICVCFYDVCVCVCVSHCGLTK
jgi:hypothetical protein